jgi:hypothetical protein
MADIEDKKVFEWIDQLDPDDLKGLEELEPFAGEGPDAAAWFRIKHRTFAQMGFGKEGNRNVVIEPTLPLRKIALRAPKRWLAAVCAAVVLSTVVITFSPNVRAELKKVLQFIPGFGYVQQYSDPAQKAYVLQKPVETQGENGKVTVDGVLIQGARGQIALSGDQVSATTFKSVILDTDLGQFEFKQSTASWGNGGPWQAGYYYEGSIPFNGLGNATLRLGNTVIGPLHLTQAKTADDLLGLGPSDFNNGIRITGVVTPLDGNHRKVNLLTQLTGQQIVDSFGKEPITVGRQLQLTDGKGNTLEIIKDSGFAKPRELLFDDPTGGEEYYQLMIPSIRIVDPEVPHEKVTLPVPVEGIQDIHVTLNISGFPIDFTRVERVNEKSVRVEVNTHFDATQPKTLQNYRLFNKDGIGMSYSSKVNESSRAIELEWLEVKPGQKEISFYIGEPQIVVKGPWILRGLH